MSKPSDSTPSKSIIDQSPHRIACANMDYLDVVTDVIPLSMVPRHVPTKRRARTHTGKKVRPSTVSKSSNPYGSVQILSSEIRNIDPSVAVKKPHYMNNLYLGPIKTTNVEPDVVASAKGSIVPKAVGSVESTEKPEFEKPESDSGIVSIDNPRSDKTLGQSSINDADKNIVDKIISVLISQILGIESNSDVVSDVTTSLAQTDHSIETLPEKYDGKSNSESVIVKSPKKYKEKDDSNCMFVDISDKEENVGVKKDQSTYIVNVEDLDSDDESIDLARPHEIVPASYFSLESLKYEELNEEGIISGPSPKATYYKLAKQVCNFENHC
ncbi:hypothetical protein KIW84_073508 [Lathyrus oleraceus]|uniref:Uncharacterized protein n=1 Tax=Pisum sativum TaxID=3888 RepID=A0A9D4VPP0_PEA|nr:hypothetical protein KIW84_073508 [Pisum sativum]